MSVLSTSLVMDSVGSNSIPSKFCSAVIMILVCCAGYAFPLYYKTTKMASTKNNNFILYCTTFVAGSFLGLVFFHLLPEAVGDSHLKITLFNSHESFDLIWVAILIGILLSLIVDKAFHSHMNHHEHEPEHTDLLTRNHSNNNAYTEKHLEQCSSTMEDISLTLTPNESEHCACQVTSTFGSLITVLVTTACIVIHGIYDGLIIGALHTTVVVWITTLLIAGHKLPVAFALAVFFIQKETPSWLLTLALTVFTLSTPLGIFLGVLSTQSKELAFAQFISGISIGAIIYFGIELISESMGKVSRSNHAAKRCCIVAGVVTLGATFIFILTLLTHTYTDHSTGSH